MIQCGFESIPSHLQQMFTMHTSGEDWGGGVGGGGGKKNVKHGYHFGISEKKRKEMVKQINLLLFTIKLQSFIQTLTLLSSFIPNSNIRDI